MKIDYSSNPLPPFGEALACFWSAALAVWPGKGDWTCQRTKKFSRWSGHQSQLIFHPINLLLLLCDVHFRRSCLGWKASKKMLDINEHTYLWVCLRLHTPAAFWWGTCLRSLSRFRLLTCKVIRSIIIWKYHEIPNLRMVGARSKGPETSSLHCTFTRIAYSRFTKCFKKASTPLHNFVARFKDMVTLQSLPALPI